MNEAWTRELNRPGLLRGVDAYWVHPSCGEILHLLIPSYVSVCLPVQVGNG